MRGSLGVGSLVYGVRQAHAVRNSRRGSRKNIHAHYDLGNAFYRCGSTDDDLLVGPLRAADSTPLEDAQTGKVRAHRSTDRRPSRATTCWRSAAAGAASPRPRPAVAARVTGVTISQEQLAYARERLTAPGLADRVDLRLP